MRITTYDPLMHAPNQGRDAWRRRRMEMEAGGDRFGPEGPHSRSRWQLLKLLIRSISG